jgi:hypothetical protein
MNTPRFLGRAHTQDGAPRGPRPIIESNYDLLRYRDQQLELMKAGQITERLYRIRVRRECENYRQFSLARYERQEYERERAAANQPTKEQQP